MDQETDIQQSPASYIKHSEFKIRVGKLDEIRQLGVDPYPHKFHPEHFAELLHRQHDGDEVGQSEDAMAGSTPEVCVAGRLVLFRAMGKNAFGQIQDGTGRIQVIFNRDASTVTGYDPENAPVAQPPSPIKFIEKRLDLGDHIGVRGHLFRTQKGELTIFVQEVTLLCKSLLPLADKHGGLVDKETRYRKRWLDLISNEDVRQAFHTRSQIVRTIRDQMHELNFMEVETPALQSIYGGAAARPFETHLNSLDQDMFLRISLEIPLKKLVVGGMERVFEIGKVFRNESIDRNHNPEFTLFEAYAAYWDYHDLMEFVEKLFEKVAIAIHGNTSIPFGDDLKLDMSAPWKRMTMKESLVEYAQIDVDSMTDDELIAKLVSTESYQTEDLKGRPRGLLIADLFEDFVEDKLIQPHHRPPH